MGKVLSRGPTWNPVPPPRWRETAREEPREGGAMAGRPTAGEAERGGRGGRKFPGRDSAGRGWWLRNPRRLGPWEREEVVETGGEARARGERRWRNPS